MKRVVLTLVAALLSIAAMAQTCPVNINGLSAMNAAKGGAKDALPTWAPISQNVTATDINGNTISTADIMNSGKAMVIDFSAVWCSWCWVMHQNGILDAIKTQLGTDVEVLWVEADPSTTPGVGLTGGGSSQGDWTVLYNTTTPVPYPIIDDASFTNLIGGSSVITGFPTVVFVSPTGYWCDVYGTDWGFGPYSASDAVTAVSALLNSYPRAGELPQVAINGKRAAFVGTSVPFSATIVSVDPIDSINWTFTGADNPTGTGATPTAPTWSTAGNYTVSCRVVNSTGATTANHDITIRDGWSWGDEMDYTEGGEYVSAIGLQSGAEFEWGILYPAELMTGRSYATKVSAYINSGVTGTYTVRVYQGGTTAPQTLLYEYPFEVTQSGQWVDFNILGGLALDPTQSMWVTLSTSGYAACYTTYNEDPNSSLLTMNGTWYTLSDATSGYYEGTWMIKTTTSDVRPAFDFILSGPTSFVNGATKDFVINGPSDATYNWTLQGATPATATGLTASASWANPGTYTISVEGSLSGTNLTKTLDVTVIDGSITLPFNETFEGDLAYWTAIDADGDGYTWMDAGFDGHNSNTAIGSASYINNIGVLTPNNWLISNPFQVPAEGATIEWWEYGVDNNDYADHYSVYVSNGGDQPSDFTTAIFTGEPTAPKTWVKHSRFIPTTGNTRVAFRHHDVTNMYWLLIDDIKITAGNTAAIDDVNTAKVDFYPNPVNDKLYISEEVLEVSVVDVNGRTVANGKNTRVVDMSELSNGVYFVRVITDNGIATKKIVKK